MNYFRAYAFTCICGRHVKGRYPIDKWAPMQLNGIGTPIDPTKAVCRMTKGAPSFPSSSVPTRQSVGVHEVGCGRTLAEVDAELAKQKEEANEPRTVR